MNIIILYFISHSTGTGRHNKYYRYMKDRALELGEISFRESYELNEDKIKKIIYSKSHYR